MFFGHYEHTLDAKGRLCIPAKFRSGIDKTVYILKGYDGCLSIYAKEDFAPQIEEFKALSFQKSTSRAHLRVNFASIDEVDVDGQGRLQIPARLLLKEGIGKEVSIVGVMDHFEIWDRERWQHYYDENYARDEEIAEAIDQGRGNSHE